MRSLINLLTLKLIFLINLIICSVSTADNHNIYETLELIQKDMKTLEKAVYSKAAESNSTSVNVSNQNLNSEDVLTRHLLKLTEIENQFQQLTNRFEEINFKLDKLSNRLSKVQADNQIRFQDIENILSIDGKIKSVTKKDTKKNNKALPGSSRTTRSGINIL